jgi:hypothetical protein
VFLCSRKQEDVDATLQDLATKGFKAHGCVADVSNREQCQILVTKVSVTAMACLTRSHLVHLGAIALSQNQSSTAVGSDLVQVQPAVKAGVTGSADAASGWLFGEVKP